MINILTEENFSELIEFRKQFIKQKFIMYFNYGVIKDGLIKKQIFGIFENKKLVAYLWIRHLIRKPISKIDEICSIKKGCGGKLLKFAQSTSPHFLLELQVVNFNNNAIDFYKYKGFNIVGEKKGKILNLIMRKEINKNIKLI